MPRLARWALALGAAAALALPAAARADDPREREGPHEAVEEEHGEDEERGEQIDEPLEEGERRPVPDYDGRPERGTDAEDVALWIPRVIFAPVYSVTEYVVRRPIGFVVTELERVHAFRWLRELFTFGPDRQAGIFPTAFWELGFNPSVGVFAYWDRFLVDENQIRLSGGTWGPDWLSLTVTDRLRPLPFVGIVGRFEAVQRPDQLFGGIGWNATRNERSRYSIGRIDASLRVEHAPWRQSIVIYEIGYRSASFESHPFHDDPGLLDVNQPPAGFLEGYNDVRAGAELVLDSREVRELSTGGVRAAVFAVQHAAFGGVPLTRWVHWGGSLLLASDALGHGRILQLRGDVGLISLFDGHPDAAVPFTELIDLGGSQTTAHASVGVMPGFRPGLVRGTSAAVVSVSYVWPVWVFADAHLRFGVGNVFGDYFEDFEFERLRMSFDFGLLPRIDGEHRFELLIGLGTHTFDAGAGITSVRVALGARSGI